MNFIHLNTAKVMKLFLLATFLEHKNILSGSTSFFGMHARLEERFHHGCGLFILPAVATDAESSKLGSLPPKY